MKHKNIIELYEYTENSDEIALFLEFANKPFFLNETILEQHTPIEDEDTMRRYAKDILSGLNYIHKLGIIHGDLKLPNLLCHQDGDDIIVKICDFGLAHITEKGTIFIEDVSGTFGHIAPEVKSNTNITTAVDIW